MDYEAMVRGAEERIRLAEEALHRAQVAEATALQHVMQASFLRTEGRVGEDAMAHWYSLVDGVRDDLDACRRRLERARADRLAVEDQRALMRR